jgi:type II secretory pathway component PulF
MKTQSRSKNLRIASLVVLSVAAAALLLPAYALVFIAPVFEEMFENSQATLPASTALLLSIPPMGCIFIFALMMIGLIVKEVLIRNKKVTLAVNAVTVFAVFLFLFFFIWIIYLPIHHAGSLQ